MAKVVRAEADILCRVLHLPRVEAGNTEAARDPARGIGHDLHQAGGADVRTRDVDEAAFLAHQAEHPRLVDLLHTGRLLRQLAVGRDEAQFEIVQVAGALGRINGAVEPAQPARNLRRSEQIHVVELLDAPVPFLRRLAAQAQLVQRHCTRDAGMARDGVNVSAADLDVDGGCLQHRAQLFLRELAVIVVLARQRDKALVGGECLPRRLQRARVPVAPRRLCTRLTHALDGAPHRVPAACAQCAADPPLALRVVERDRASTLEQREGICLVAARRPRRQKSPGVALFRRGELLQPLFECRARTCGIQFREQVQRIQGDFTTGAAVEILRACQPARGVACRRIELGGCRALRIG